MDELKQSVQLAVHEQDPLLIYKFGNFQLIQRYANGINKSNFVLVQRRFATTNRPEIQKARDNS
jgi:hypothetical protein